MGISQTLQLFLEASYHLVSHCLATLLLFSGILSFLSVLSGRRVWSFMASLDQCKIYLLWDLTGNRLLGTGTRL